MLVNQTESIGGAPQFQDEAILCGLATNGAGQMQASMGIAFGDVDRDGEPDQFQSNYQGEPNTLYLGVGGGYFNDATARARLYASSLPMLGWEPSSWTRTLTGGRI